MPNYFGFLTVMALHVFLQEKVDVAIMEVGIGGQYDSTNLIKHPVVCGVSSLGIDHTSVLGSSIDKIAWHKAGIFKVSNFCVFTWFYDTHSIPSCSISIVSAVSVVRWHLCQQLILISHF